MTFGGAGTPASVADLESEYELLDELGRGGMAVVYRGRERATGREVAIKVLRAGATSDAAEAQARFAREAQTVAQLQHPNIVATYAVRPITSGGLGIVMELVSARTLKEVVREEGRFDPERASDVLRQMADALAYAHAKGVVHRDVKPENIFLDERSDAALLSDFGIARTIETDAALTQTGIAIGTPTYMSPEQIDGRAVDGRGDIYSLGLVGWEMLAGRQPWEGESLYSVIYKQKHDELAPLSELRHDVPEDLQYVIERALAKDRDERWQRADEMLQALVHGPDPLAVHRWRSRRSRRVSPALAAAIEREALTSETIRYRREEFALPDVDDDAAGPTPGAVSRRRALAVGAAALLFALGGVSALVLAGRERDRFGEVRTESGRRVSSEAPEGALPRAAPSGTSLGEVIGGDSVALDTAPQPAGTGTTPPTPTGVPAPTNTKAGADAGTVEVPLANGSVPPPAARPGASPSGGASTPSVGAPSVGAPSVVAPVAPAEAAVPAAPRPVVNLAVERAPLAAGGRHTCVLTGRGEGRCFGGNERGQLGDGGVASDGAPARVAGAFQFASVAAGSSHSCGVTRGGAVYCWGANDRGQLGDATSTPRDAPVRVVADAPFRAVRLGTAHTCALTRAGEVLCWGSNARGQLGDGTTTDHLVPTAVAPPAGRYFTSLAVGWNHSCALDDGGHAFCWGDNSGGQLGDGTRGPRATPTPVAGGVEFASISAGATHTCALSRGGDAYCWGRNNFGQLGSGRTGDQTVPARVSSPTPFVAIAAGGVHSCALARGGEAFCWGRNTYGQLGDGTTNDSAVPTRVIGGFNFVFINASGAHSCGATSGGESLCWGYNIDGQLGDGTRTHRSRPVRVGGGG